MGVDADIIDKIKLQQFGGYDFSLFPIERKVTSATHNNGRICVELAEVLVGGYPEYEVEYYWQLSGTNSQFRLENIKLVE